MLQNKPFLHKVGRQALLLAASMGSALALSLTPYAEKALPVYADYNPSIIYPQQGQAITQMRAFFHELGYDLQGGSILFLLLLIVLYFVYSASAKRMDRRRGAVAAAGGLVLGVT